MNDGAKYWDLSLRELYGLTFLLLRQRWQVILTAILLFRLPVNLFNSWEPSFSYHWNNQLLTGLDISLEFVGLVLLLLFLGVLSFIAKAGFEDETISLEKALDLSVRRLPAMFSGGLLVLAMGFGIMNLWRFFELLQLPFGSPWYRLLTIMFFLGIFFMIFLVFTVPAAALANKWGHVALSYSFNMVKGQKGVVIGVLLGLLPMELTSRIVLYLLGQFWPAHFIPHGLALTIADLPRGLWYIAISLVFLNIHYH